MLSSDGLGTEGPGVDSKGRPPTINLVLSSSVGVEEPELGDRAFEIACTGKAKEARGLHQMKIGDLFPPLLVPRLGDLR